MPVWLNTPMTGLEIEDGQVTGVRVTRDGEPALIRASRGVLLATGGFERNDEMRQRYQRAPIGTDWTVGSPGNTGDGIAGRRGRRRRAGADGRRVVGAVDPADRAGPVFCLAERSLPGCIFVNGAGERFVNEAAPYVDAVHAMYDKHTEDNPHIPCWMITDQRYRNRYVFTGMPPRKPLPRRWYKSGAVVQGRLAGRAGQPRSACSPDGLAKTVEKFNEFARAGKDEDFGRGDSAYDHYYGDPNCKPNPNLAPLAQPPFYAIKIVPGDLGTKGGLRTDERARVLRADGSVIDGLYAAGNTSALVMGRSYAGPGRHHRPGHDVRLPGGARCRPRQRVITARPPYREAMPVTAVPRLSGQGTRTDAAEARACSALAHTITSCCSTLSEEELAEPGLEHLLGAMAAGRSGDRDLARLGHRG